MKLKKGSRYKEKETIKEKASLFTRDPIQIQITGDFYLEDAEIMKIKFVKIKQKRKYKKAWQKKICHALVLSSLQIQFQNTSLQRKIDFKISHKNITQK